MADAQRGEPPAAGDGGGELRPPEQRRRGGEECLVDHARADELLHDTIPLYAAKSYRSYSGNSGERVVIIFLSECLVLSCRKEKIKS